MHSYKGMTHSSYTMQIFLSTSKVSTPQFEERPTSTKTLSRLPSRVNIETMDEAKETYQENVEMTLQRLRDDLLKVNKLYQFFRSS